MDVQVISSSFLTDRKPPSDTSAALILQEAAFVS